MFHKEIDIEFNFVYTVSGGDACTTIAVPFEGDTCIDTNPALPITYLHNGGIAGTMDDWTELETVGYVSSVNGDTGVVTGMEETADRQNPLFRFHY